jgi:hypothetical protein
MRANLVSGSISVALACAMLARAEEAAPPGKAHAGHMIYIENQDIRLGIDPDIGGAITYLAPATNQALNVINSFDWGRQVQFSFYSGPVPYQPAAAKLSDSWRSLGWNPIQSGDCYGHQSKVLKYSRGENSLYVKCVPMQWPLDNVPAESEGEVWLELAGPVVKAHCRLTNHRADLSQYPARTQELPAVYVNAPFHRLLTYRGDHPFTGDAPTQINVRLDKDGHWESWPATEHWAAQLDDHDWGLGVWSPTALQFSGGFYSEPGRGGPSDAPTGYIAPNQKEILDHNIVYDYRYELILGTLAQIRAHARQRNSSTGLNYNFETSREGWTYADAGDTGWPIQGKLDIRVTGNQPHIFSPEFFLPAGRIKQLRLQAAFSTGNTNATLYWRKLNQNNFSVSQSLQFRIIPDGKFRDYSIPLAACPQFTGSIIQFRLDPVPGGAPNSTVQIKSFRSE